MAKAFLCPQVDPYLLDPSSQALFNLAKLTSLNMKLTEPDLFGFFDEFTLTTESYSEMIRLYVFFIPPHGRLTAVRVNIAYFSASTSFGAKAKARYLSRYRTSLSLRRAITLHRVCHVSTYFAVSLISRQRVCVST